MPTWPQPGALTPRQKARRLVKDVLCGLGVSEGWTDTFVSEADHEDVGLPPGRARVQPAARSRTSDALLPGLPGALPITPGGDSRT